MIFKDAVQDTVFRPGERVGELCLNCTGVFQAHDGWACIGLRSPLENFTWFPSVKLNARYVTRSMLESVVPGVTLDTLHLKFNEWLNSEDEPVAVVPVVAPKNPLYEPLRWTDFVHRVPGECVCGGTIGVCTYHPGDRVNT